MRLQDTEGFMMIEFANKVRHLKGRPFNEVKDEIKKAGTPYIEKMMRNHGHSLHLAASLLAEVWKELPDAVTQPELQST